MKNLKYILLLFTLSFFSCQNEPIGENAQSKTEIIKKDSELYTLLEKVTTKGKNVTENIVCIDFIYPFKLILYDENLAPIGSKVLSSDIQFSEFLGSLSVDQSISISYPISTKMDDDTVFEVNNNQELKIAIDSCSKEDIIAYCNSLFGGCNCEEKICIWKIPYTLGNDNKYASGFFESNKDGTLLFNYNGLNYKGTWVFLFVDNKLHLNINIEGDSHTAKDWNIDRMIELNDDEIVIKNDIKDIILRRHCQSTKKYIIGDKGPAGGIVFYDKGSYSNGWRYMEASPLDANESEWGCLGSLIDNANSSEIGAGLLNSVSITNYHDKLNNYYTNPSICNPANNGSVASRESLLYNINNTKDWFLPSENELSLLYNNLKTEDLSTFKNTNYWSSTQMDENNAICIDFSNGNVISHSKVNSNNCQVRFIRYF
jgi:hypothetical protein